jgi:intracellular septation protein
MKWFRSLIEEVGPIVVFGLANYLADFETAVLAMVGSLVLVTVATSIHTRGLPWFAIVSTAGIVLFAGLSFWFDDFSFFTASDTILDGILGITILWSLRWKKPLIQRLFDRTFAITDEAWRILTVRWGTLFIVLAILNEIVRLNVTNEVWAYFKVGATIFILLFGCFQFFLSMRMRIPEESNRFGLRI